MLKIALLLTMISVKLYSQNIGLVFNQIKNIPCNYYPKAIPKEAVSSIQVDSSFKYIIDQDVAVIPWLIEKMSDTLFTTIKKPGEESFLRKGDVAIILIEHIRPVPWNKITHMQFDICCDCGLLPIGFLSYLDENRADFQVNYRTYYSSNKQ